MKRRERFLVSLDLPGIPGCFFIWPHVPLAVLALAILAGGFYFAGASGSDPRAYGNDFNVFYHASREALAGRSPYLSSLGDWTPYVYPPLLAFLLIPVALLPLPLAAYLWFVVNAIATVTAAWLSAKLACRETGDCDSRENQALGERVLVALVAIASLVFLARFVLDNFSLGQVNPLVAGLVVAHVFLYSTNRKVSSALALAVAASIKLTPVVLIGYHLGRRRWRFAAACAGLLLLVTAGSFLPLGSQAPEAMRFFVRRTIRNEQGYDLAYAGNQSLRGAVERMRPAPAEDENRESARGPADAVTLLMSLGILAVATIAAMKARAELSAAAPFLCCAVLLSPLSWKAHFVMLIAPVASLIAGAVRCRRTTRGTVIAGALGVSFMLFNLTSPRLIGARAAERADALSLVFAAALLVFAVSVSLALNKARNAKR